MFEIPRLFRGSKAARNGLHYLLHFHIPKMQAIGTQGQRLWGEHKCNLAASSCQQKRMADVPRMPRLHRAELGILPHDMLMQDTILLLVRYPVETMHLSSMGRGLPPWDSSTKGQEQTWSWCRSVHCASGHTAADRAASRHFKGKSWMWTSFLEISGWRRKMWIV